MPRWIHSWTDIPYKTWFSQDGTLKVTTSQFSNRPIVVSRNTRVIIRLTKEELHELAEQLKLAVAAVQKATMRTIEDTTPYRPRTKYEGP